MNRSKIWALTLLIALMLNFVAPLSVSHAAGAYSLLSKLASQTTPTEGSSGVLAQLFSLLFEKLLDPLVNIFHGNSPAKNDTASTLSATTSPLSDNSVLHGKVIVLDPGHGGTNPGAVANGDREADNNLAVGLKLRDKLDQAGAKVVMTRDTDRNVASPDATLSEELQARVDIANANHANIFVSIHSNENSDASITGAETFYANGKSSQLAQDIENRLLQETGEVNKGVHPENFYVMRNNYMPNTLVEMGFVSNPDEANLLKSDTYRNKVASGIFNGIVEYFNNND